MSGRTSSVLGSLLYVVALRASGVPWGYLRPKSWRRSSATSPGRSMRCRTLQAIVRRCLREAPGQRYQTVARTPCGARTTPGQAANRRPSIAVLPFANMGADKENEYFSDGLAEEIINFLAQIPG